ncbi:MAG: hypothetical protein HY507_00725 [Candidatus Zambryskibacteria bacterium]|nr:hypothetical protein [Candidatus Zambryskibacteria bacterium]
MIKRKSTFFLGIFIFLVPFLGLPSSWKTSLIILSGLTLIFLSVKILLPNKMLKHHKNRKEKTQPTIVENIPESVYSAESSENFETDNK